MSQVIVISSNCQIGGLAAVIRAIFPESVIKPFPIPDTLNLVQSEHLSQELKGATIWLTSGCTELAEALNIKVIKVPTIFFSAFHPDLCYARKESTQQLTSIHYNSKIAIWGYNNRIDPSDMARLFNSNIYRALGYFDQWDSQVAELQQTFLKSNIKKSDFDRFFLAVKRRGNFMHSINHPHAFAIVELGKLLAEKIQPRKEMIDREIVIPDGLTDSIWPLYTEIGEELGIEGNYCWRVNGKEISGVRSYLDFVYEKYREQKIEPLDLHPFGARGFDEVLRLELSR